MCAQSLDLANIQGNILGGFNKDYQAFLFLRFTREHRTHEWLMEISENDGIATTQDVLASHARYRQMPPQRRGELREKLINIAFTYHGLLHLGKTWADLTALSDAFRQGMSERPEILGDTDDSAPKNWLPAFRPPALHAVLILAADKDQDLTDMVTDHIERFARYDIGLLLDERSATRKNQANHRIDHFGFHDGVSQPGVVGITTRPEPGQVLIQPGEFVLGHPVEIAQGDSGDNGLPRTEIPDWAVDGSYLVIRRLRQQVVAFEQFVAETASKLKIHEDAVAAKLVGRYKSGARLDPAQALSGADPGFAKPELLAEDQIDDFEYAAKDSKGLVVPHAAHIRKVNPRNTLKHRLLRRGVPFGAWDSGSDARWPNDRGLLFLCYQASIENQFELVQQRRINTSSVAPFTDEPDALISQRDSTRHVNFPGITSAPLSLERFVITTGGEYFFQPSVLTLRRMAGA
jgi:Dyp-type peroxidase family